MKWILGIFVAALLAFVAAAPYLTGSTGTVGSIMALRDATNSTISEKIATVQLLHQTVEATLYDTQSSYRVGDQVILTRDAAAGGYTIADQLRTPALLQIFGIFLIVAVLMAGLSGVRALMGLYISFAILFSFVLPQISNGADPLVVTLMASVLILVVTYYLAHGISTKTTIAVVGTAIALFVTGILAVSFGALAHLNGFGNEAAAYLPQSLAQGSTIYHLLLAGIIIATLGVLNDITIAQSSVVSELHDASTKMSTRELFTRGMRVGHDHIASLVNTLILVYAGSALPLLILFTNSREAPLALVNYEALAEEIVRTMVASIGLVLAVPITTGIAAWWYSKKKRR